MKNVLFLLPLLILLNSCAESIALLGTSASNGKIVQSSLNSAISYGVKKQTGKSPLEHAIAYAEEINPERKKKPAFHLLKLLVLNFAPLLKDKLRQKIPQ